MKIWCCYFTEVSTKFLWLWASSALSEIDFTPVVSDRVYW